MLQSLLYWYSSPLVSIAHNIRAFLFARATAATFVFRRWIKLPNQPSSDSEFFLACITALAPWFSNVRRYESPRLLIPSKTFRPPLECCLGTRPSQEDNCRPFLNSVPSPIVPTMAVAVSKPIPGNVAIRLLRAHCL